MNKNTPTEPPENARPHANRASRAAWRIILPAALTVAFFVLALWLLYLPALENTAMDRKREMIRELNSVAMSIIQDQYDDALAGKTSMQEAKTMAMNHLKAMRYGPDNAITSGSTT